MQLIIYDIANGSGGRTHKLEFKNLAAYADIAGNGDYDANMDMTADKVRKGLVKAVERVVAVCDSTWSS